MPSPLFSVLPVLRNLPTGHPREPLLPGLKRRPAGLWPALVVLAAAVVGTASLWRVAGPEGAAPSRRSVAAGRVMQVERIGVPQGASQTFVKYRFVAGKKIWTGNELVASRADVPAPGDEIRVSYDAAAPQDNFRAASPQQERNQRQATRIALVAGPLLVFLWLFLMLSLFAPFSPRDWLEWRRARDLYRNGEITAGRVQFVRPQSVLRSPGNATPYEIVATYKVEGVRLPVATRCNNAWLIGHLAPETEVVIAHDPLKPERAVILEPFAF